MALSEISRSKNFMHQEQFFDLISSTTMKIGKNSQITCAEIDEVVTVVIRTKVEGDNISPKKFGRNEKQRSYIRYIRRDDKCFMDKCHHENGHFVLV